MVSVWSSKDIVLNAVALAFVLDVDELVANVLLTEKLRGSADGAQTAQFSFEEVFVAVMRSKGSLFKKYGFVLKHEDCQDKQLETQTDFFLVLHHVNLQVDPVEACCPRSSRSPVATRGPISRPCALTWLRICGLKALA